MSKTVRKFGAGLVAFVCGLSLAGPALVFATAAAEGPYIAAIIRYVRDGEPVSIKSAEQMQPTRLLQGHLAKGGAQVIDIMEFSAQFSSLEFDKVKGCVVTGASNPDCRESVEYPNAVVRIMSQVRSRGAESELYAQHLRKLKQCGGVIVVGEVSSEKSGRDTVNIQVDVTAVDYASLANVMTPYSESRSGLYGPETRGRGVVEKKLVGNELSIAAERLTKKLAEKPHYKSC